MTRIAKKRIAKKKCQKNVPSMHLAATPLESRLQAESGSPSLARRAGVGDPVRVSALAGRIFRLKARRQRGPAQVRKRRRMSRSPVGVSRTGTNSANEYQDVIAKFFCGKGLRRCLCSWWTKRRPRKAVSQTAHLGGPRRSETARLARPSRFWTGWKPAPRSWPRPTWRTGRESHPTTEV